MNSTRFFIFILWAFSVLLPTSANAEKAISPTSMQIVSRWSLDESIIDIGFFADSRYVYTLSGKEEPILQSWLLEDLESNPQNAVPLATTKLSAGVDIQILAYGTGLVSLVKQDRQLEVSYLNLNLIKSSLKRFKVNGNAQKMTVLFNGLIVIPILEKDETRILHISTKGGLKLDNISRIDRPIEAVWAEPKTGLLFANNLSSPLLYTTREGNKIDSVFGYSNDGIPFATNLRHYTAECFNKFGDLEQPMVIADYSLGTVYALTFEKSFDEFEVKALVQIRPKRTIGSLIGAKIDLIAQKTPLLLTASCDRSRILLGSSNSQEIVQMSYNSSFEVLDVVESIRIDTFPDFLKVSRTGERALVASKRSGRIRVLAAMRNSKPLEEQLRIDEIREIQRILTSLGYSVGAIDGKIGPRTNRALDRLEKIKKIEVPREDISKMAEIFRELSLEEIKQIEP